MNVGHLARDDDLVAVEVVGLLAAFLFRRGRVGFLGRICNTSFHHWATGGRLGCPVRRRYICG